MNCADCATSHRCAELEAVLEKAREMLNSQELMTVAVQLRLMQAEHDNAILRRLLKEREGTNEI